MIPVGTVARIVLYESGTWIVVLPEDEAKLPTAYYAIGSHRYPNVLHPSQESTSRIIGSFMAKWNGTEEGWWPFE